MGGSGPRERLRGHWGQEKTMIDNDVGANGTGPNPESRCAGQPDRGEMPQEMATAIFDCLYDYWINLGIPADRAAAAARRAIETIWQRRNEPDTWLLAPPE
jgi:hypothetical protein